MCSYRLLFYTHPTLDTLHLAFVRAGIHDDVPLISIAKEALRRLQKMQPVPGSLFARAFIRADLESPKVNILLEGLASIAREKGWTHLSPKPQFEQTDFQKQCAERIQDFLPSILVNQRHEMGPLLSLVLPQGDEPHLNLEVDPLEPPSFPGWTGQRALGAISSWRTWVCRC